MKKILLFCCKGFETMEFSPFVDVIGWTRTDFGEEIYVMRVAYGFSVQQLSDPGKYKFRYQILSKLGMGRRRIRIVVAKQLF